MKQSNSIQKFRKVKQHDFPLKGNTDIWFPASEQYSSVVLLEACNWKINLSSTNRDAEQRSSDTTCPDIQLRDIGEQRFLPENSSKGILSAP